MNNLETIKNNLMATSPLVSQITTCFQMRSELESSLKRVDQNLIEALHKVITDLVNTWEGTLIMVLKEPVSEVTRVAERLEQVSLLEVTPTEDNDEATLRVLIDGKSLTLSSELVSPEKLVFTFEVMLAAGKSTSFSVDSAVIVDYLFIQDEVETSVGVIVNQVLVEVTEAMSRKD